MSSSPRGPTFTQLYGSEALGSLPTRGSDATNRHVSQLMAPKQGLLKIADLTPGPVGIHGGILSGVDTTIKIGAETRDKLAALAEARNMSMRALIEEFAATALTPAQLRERAERTDAFLAAEFGHRVSDDEAGALRERMRQAQNAGQTRARGTAA